MGIVSSILNEGFPPKSKFAVEDILDLTGKVIIVTGANTGMSLSSLLITALTSPLFESNTGIGKETAKASTTVDS